MTSATLNQELDSSFLKGLRLLHSSEPDAEEELQKLWQQSIVEKYGSDRTPMSVLHKITLPSGLKRENQDAVDDSVVEVKRSKLESSLFLKSSASASPQQTTAVDSEIHNGSSNEDSDSESPLEILNTEGVCMKCKSSTSSNNNKLVECVDCQKHYHQLCHFPPITDMDLSDPRFVWYCATCDQNITTTTTTSSNKTKTSSTSSNATVKSVTSSKGTTSISKKSRTFSTSSTSKTPTQASIGSTLRSTDSNSKDSSISTEKKGHMMKKRSMKKPDKKKSTK